MNAEMNEFLLEHGLERDPSRSDLGNVITTPRAKKSLGFPHTYTIIDGVGHSLKNIV